MNILLDSAEKYKQRIQNESVIATVVLNALSTISLMYSNRESLRQTAAAILNTCTQTQKDTWQLAADRENQQRILKGKSGEGKLIL